MLVLSRRLRESIRFPGFDTSVQVVGIKGGVVRLGIEAPPRVAILREEIPDRGAIWGPLEAGAPSMEREPSLVMRQGLKTASMALGLARFQLRTGQTQELEATLDKIHVEIQRLRQHLDGGQTRPAGRIAHRPRRASADELLAGHLD